MTSFRDYRDVIQAKGIRKPVQPAVRARRPGEPVRIERTEHLPGHVVLGNSTRPAVRIEDAAA